MAQLFLLLAKTAGSFDKIVITSNVKLQCGTNMITLWKSFLSFANER